MSDTAEESNKPLQIGDYAPDFTLDSDDGSVITLTEMRGQKIVIYFYPKDDTPGCTVEAQDFTKLYSQFDDLGITVIGVSKDSCDSHSQFRDKYNLTHKLVSDETGSVCEAYDCWVEKNMYGKKYMGIQRDTFLVDKHGILKEIWRKVKVEGHAQDVLDKASQI